MSIINATYRQGCRASTRPEEAGCLAWIFSFGLRTPHGQVSQAIGEIFSLVQHRIDFLNNRGIRPQTMRKLPSRPGRGIAFGETVAILKHRFDLFTFPQTLAETPISTQG